MSSDYQIQGKLDTKDEKKQNFLGDAIANMDKQLRRNLDRENHYSEDKTELKAQPITTKNYDKRMSVLRKLDTIRDNTASHDTEDDFVYKVDLNPFVSFNLMDGQEEPVKKSYDKANFNNKKKKTRIVSIVKNLEFLKSSSGNFKDSMKASCILGATERRSNFVEIRRSNLNLDVHKSRLDANVEYNNDFRKTNGLK